VDEAAKALKIKKKKKLAEKIAEKECPPSFHFVPFS
jgi:hypothetical protein